MAAKSMCCAVCFRRKKSAIAIKYCTDCEDALCVDCVDVHGNIKSCISHHIVDVDVDSQIFAVDKFCKVHPDLCLDIYCSDHDELCCRSCMVGDHRSCGKLIPIEEAAKGVKESTMYQEFSKDLDSLKNASSTLEDQKIDDKTSLENDKASIHNAVFKFKEELLKRINEIEIDIMTEENKIYTEISKQISDDLLKLDNGKKTVQCIFDQFESMTKHGSDNQIFRMLQNKKEELNKQVKAIQDVFESKTASSITFEKSNLLSLLKSFGSITVKQRHSNNEHHPLRVKQAQYLQKQKLVASVVKLDRKVDLKNTYITCICVTQDDLFLLCNWTGSNVIVMTNTGQEMQRIAIGGNPWNMAIEKNKNYAWVTMPSNNCIKSVDTSAIKITEKFQVSEKCYGITLVDDWIILGCKGKLLFMTKSGEESKNCSIGNDRLFSISRNIGDSQHLYICQTDGTPKLYCVKFDGTVVMSRDSPEFGRPIDVQLHFDNLYVLDWSNNSLKRMSPKGETLKTILSASDGLAEPYAFGFSKDFSKLLVFNNRTKQILIYNCN